jgi:hypothetical protein
MEIEEINCERKIDSFLDEFYATTMASTIFTSRNPEIGISLSLQMYTKAINHYVMRAENLPPRKNVFSRAKDKVKKYFEEKAKSPSGNPLPEPGCFGCKKELSDYL